MPKQKREKKEENYISEIRYLNRLRLKQDSLVIERKETGESLYDFAQCDKLRACTYMDNVSC